jgi:hypothetical protein
VRYGYAGPARRQAAGTKGGQYAAGIAISCAALAMSAAGCSSPAPIAAINHPVRLATAVTVRQETGSGGSGFCIPALHELPIARDPGWCAVVGARLTITRAQMVDVVADGRAGFTVELAVSAAQQGAFAAFMKRSAGHEAAVVMDGTIVQTALIQGQPPSDVFISAGTRSQAFRLWRQLTGQR